MLAEWTEGNISTSGNGSVECGVQAIVMEEAWHYIKVSPLIPGQILFNISIDLQGECMVIRFNNVGNIIGGATNFST